jgi:uncharacterized protein YjbI with pentapeptide repeats
VLRGRPYAPSMGDSTLAATAIGVGGTAIVGVVGFWASVRNTNRTTALTLRAVELTEQGQVTDRYSKAIEQLGSEKIDVRIGGIYALERIAHDSPRDHPTIMEVLAALIREHSREQWPPAEDGAEPAERATRPDVQAAVTVMGRRTIGHDKQPINLAAANLTRADLADARLGGANLARVNLTYADLDRADLASTYLALADLTGADLDRADLTGTDLTGTVLTGANFTRANLARANLGPHLADVTLGQALLGGELKYTYTDLDRANLTYANLTEANLDRANLTYARLYRANLTKANLDRANLTKANLNKANLTGASWPPDAEVPEGWQRNNDSGRLNRADTNSDAAATD